MCRTRAGTDLRSWYKYELYPEVGLSGIYGIYRYDGAPVDPRSLERMKTAMAYYGPDGGGCKIEGPVGMGHLLLEINPEDAFENQPVRGDRGLIVSTARLDNRDALLEMFDITPSEASRITDGHLLSLAFDRWGEEVCSHLQGDWALAAWDQKEHRLLLARDVFGREALYYYQGNGFIVFASSLKALLAIPGAVREPDLLRLAEDLLSWHYHAELTAYKGFRSVVGAHVITVYPNGQTRNRRFWWPEGRELLRYRQDEEYVDAFLEHYTRAVDNCLRTEKKVAAELSGGRDSGSVVNLAAPILASRGRDLTAYTSVPWLAPDGAGKGRAGNEWDLAHATAMMAGPNVQHIAIDARDCGVIEGIEYFLDLHDGPSHTACNHYWFKAEMEACSQSGTGVLLGGPMGNCTVSWPGSGSAVLALLQGNTATAFRLLFQGEPNPWYALKRQVLKPLLKPLLMQGGQLLRRLRTPYRSPWQSYSALNVKLAKELDMDGRMREAGYDPTFQLAPWEDIRKSFFWPGFGTTSCIPSELSARQSLSALDPTANLSLLEFLLRVPDDQFYRMGQRSFLIQRAFRNRMPESVLLAKPKGLQSADLGHRIVRERAAFQECLRSLESLPEAREILDLPLLNRCLAQLVTKVDPVTNERARMILAPGIGMGLFLLQLASVRSGDSNNHADRSNH